jgi:DNA gyrase inhibitor GyrI
MNEVEFNIVDLPAMTVACALGFGKEPELQALGIITEWASMTGLSHLNNRRYFGFNNPDPTPGTPNYGYEQWVTVEPNTIGTGNVQIKTFPGGRFVVMDCVGLPSPEKWAVLVQWVEDGPYQMTAGQCLEECLTPQYLFEPATMPDNMDDLHFLLYIPVAG